MNDRNIRKTFVGLVAVSLMMIAGIRLTAFSAPDFAVRRITADGVGKFGVMLSGSGATAGWLEFVDDPKVSSQEIVIVKAAATDGSWNKELFRSSNGAWISGVKGPHYNSSDTSYNLKQGQQKILFSRDGSRMVIHIDEFAKSQHHDYFDVIDVRTGAARLLPVAVPPGMGTFTGYTNYNSHGVWLTNGTLGQALSEDGRYVIYSLKAFGTLAGNGKTLDALVAMDLDTGAAVRIAGYRSMDSAGNLTPGDMEYSEARASSTGNRVVFAFNNAYYAGDFNGSPLQRIAPGDSGTPQSVGNGQYVAEERTGNFYPVAGGSTITTSLPGRGGFQFPFWDGEAGFILHPHLSHEGETVIVRAGKAMPLIKSGQEGLPAGWNFGVKQLSSSYTYSLVSSDGRSVLLSLISPEGKQDLFLLKRGIPATPPPAVTSVQTPPSPLAGSRPKEPSAQTPQLIQPADTVGILLHSQKLVASEKEQVVNYENLSVRIPGGLLAADEELRIYKPSAQMTPLINGMKQVALVDIQIGKLTKFNKPLVIEMKYDAAILDKTQPAKKQLIACYFDEKIGGWIGTPFEIDEQRGVLAIKTNHLTKWSAYYYLLGYDTYPDTKCMVIFDKKDLKNNNALYEGRTGRKSTVTGVPVLVQDVALFIDQAYRSYEQEGFALPPVTSGSPDTKLNVFVGDVAMSTRNSKSGIITINANLASKAKGLELVNLFRQDCGHELFHEIQAHKYGISGLTSLYYENKSFWLEATAEYAGDVLAWKHAIDRDGSPMTRTKIMGGDIKADYLKYSLLTFEVPGLLTAGRQKAMGHEYDSAHFVDYMVKANPQAPLTVLVNMLNRDSSFAKCFNDYFGQNGKTLEGWLADFATYFLFDNASPFPAGIARNDAADDFKGIRFKMSATRLGQLDQSEVTETFRLKPREPYSAAVMLTDLYINGKTDKENQSTSFEIDVSSDKEIRFVITGMEDRAPQKKSSVIKAAVPGGKFLANGQDKIYMIYTAANNLDAANVIIKAKAIAKTEISVEPGKLMTEPGKASELSARIINGPIQPYVVWDYGDSTVRPGATTLKTTHAYSRVGTYKGKASLYDAKDRNSILAEAEFTVLVKESKPEQDAGIDQSANPDKFIGRWRFLLSQTNGASPTWLDSYYGNQAMGKSTDSGIVEYLRIIKENGKYLLYPDSDKIQIGGSKVVIKYTAEPRVSGENPVDYIHEGAINPEGTRIEGTYRITEKGKVLSEGKWIGIKS